MTRQIIKSGQVSENRKARFNYSIEDTIEAGISLTGAEIKSIRYGLVTIVDGFVNKFGILLLIAIQCVIFGWYYGAEKVIPVLNEKSRIKVGFIWATVIKYILPIFLVIIWLIGIIDLFMNATQFELMVDIALIILVLVFSAIFYKRKSTEDMI